MSEAAKPAPEFPEVLTIAQAAAYLQLHPQVVYRHVRAGTLPASRIGRTIRFKRSVLDAFLEQTGWASVHEFLRFREERAAQAEAAEQVRRRRRFSVEVD
ncbi:MAG: helix-turn-helix domain-containing protein [Planctomycetota bacterium]|nr:helix-turn-helix domain-containing protein [Planctomycetota bacterium]